MEWQTGTVTLVCLSPIAIAILCDSRGRQ